MSEDSSSSKEEVDLDAIEARLNDADQDWCEDYEAAGRSAISDIAALLARARQQDVRIAELEAEVKGLRGTGLKEFSWSEGGYGGGFDCTIVAESLEKAREYIKKFFLNEPRTSRNFDGEFMLTNDPWDISDYIPKLSGYYEYHMDAGG
jgi:hypothetical protein